ncbi:mechanosensitive ion channel [Fulvivirga sp. M361]|uniref:mechanosensitive ion channel family protein n=1 Tax=Fulvivirga sp. M361 TaxID=2594266 RepID=UPI001179E03C|nr:mechanosensitive ion channel domain-containing protein [Fulvivirga sp. M361]TRX54283.1 mechanosensitive ion channel [Fulvivirga sp. M361]
MKKRFIYLVLLTLFSGPGFAQADTVVLQDEEKAVVTDSAQLSTDSEDVVEKARRNLQPPPISEVISFSKIFWSIIFLTIGYFFIRFIGSVLGSIAERSTRYRITIKGIIPVFNILGWVFILFVVIAGIFHPPLETIVAVTASVSIAVGFAAQDVLKNVFGGIMILFDRPFKVGDKIEIGSHYGEVLEIGLRSTRIVTADDSLVSVPNSEIMNQSVSNANAGEANCQVVAEIYLPITVDTEKARHVAMEVAQVSRFVYLNKPIVVLFFNEVKDRKSYLKMRLKAYVADIRNEFAFKSDMTEMVMRELLNAKIISPDDFK